MVTIKIKVNSVESRLVEVPEEMSLQDFYILMTRLNTVQKMLTKDYGGLDVDPFRIKLKPSKDEVELLKKEGLKLPEEESDDDENIILEPPLEADFPNEKLKAKSELVDGLFSREMMVRLLKAYWADTLDESERRIKDIIRDYDLPVIQERDEIRPMVFKAISRFQILPDEVDLTAFPTPGNSDIKNLRKKKE